MAIEEYGCINIWIDRLVPCLTDKTTHEIKETIAFKIESRSFLKQFTKEKGWHIDWYRIPKDIDVYVLALKENVNEIQGLVGLKNDTNAHAVYIHWACSAPHNNIHDYGYQKYEGVGGHLFAIAADISMKLGYEGAIHGFAGNEELLMHYIETFNAEYLGLLHQFQFFIDEQAAKKLLEVYTYEWN